MAATVLNDAVIYVDDFDFTSTTNKVTLNAQVDEQEATVFGNNGYKTIIGGLRMVEADIDGWWDAASGQNNDADNFTGFSTFNQPMSVAATSTEGSKVYLFNSARTKLEWFGAVGDVNPFSVHAIGSDTTGLVRGLIVKQKGNVSAIGVVGTPQQVGAGGAGKWLYAVIHAFTAGTTMTVQVQSAPTVGGTYTTRATFPAITAVGGYWLTRVDASAITDSWWRMNINTGGITGTFNIVGSIGVQ
jgi:hypothetical protein